MRSLIVSALLVCVLSAAAEPVNREADVGSGLICYSQEDGYSVEIPQGWVNHPEKALELGVCAIYAPSGTTFDTADAVLYPRANIIAPGTSGSKAIEALVAKTLQRFRALPGGEKLTAKKSETIKTERGLEFEIWLFNSGPRPNRYEAVAYHAGKASVFFVVLSALSEEKRDRFLPVLEKIIKTTYTLKVVVTD